MMARGTLRAAKSRGSGSRTAGSAGARGRSAGWQGSPVVTAVVSVLVWGLAAGPVLWAVLRLSGTEDGYPLFPALAFTPYAAVAALVPLGVALLARRRAAAMVTVLALIALVAVLVPRVIPSRGPEIPPDGPRLRVLSLNLEYGEADPRQVVGLVKTHRADVLSLQEADAAAVERLEGAGLREWLPHRVALDGTAWAAGALYARYPLKRLPEWDPSAEFRMPYARMDVPGAPPVEIMSVHPTPPSSETGVRWLREGLARMPSAERHKGSAGTATVRILAGDFNSTLDHAAFRQVVDRGYVDAAAQRGAGFAATWPMEGASLPGVALDHVLADARVRVEDFRVGKVGGTDHTPVYARLRLPAAGD
ncbi:MAG: endonuclease/exonuclease/phosphatase family protein [Streptosporangiales bacterium]|nr:endonuclease/exonuclease/phosphatase family protein [Streptosporangiales bacterium]